MCRSATRRLIPVIVLLLTAGLAATAESEPSATADQADIMAFYEADLPPKGTRSLFDRLVLSRGPVPFPFSDLTALLRGYSEDDAPLVSLFVPDGRSLVRAKGDFHHPRVLAALAAQPKPDSGAPALRSRLFIGYVEDAAQIEVISYNDRAGRFEYQLVDDYREGDQPRVRYAPRSLCQTCHHDGSALFSVRPWAETNANAAVARRIAGARAADIDGGYLGLPFKQPLSAAQQFDALTDNASILLTSQRAWMEGCGGGEAGRQCRRLMLVAVLHFSWSQASFDLHGAEVEALRQAQRKVWPAYGIPLPSVDIRSRDPFAPPQTRSLMEQIEAWFEPDPEGSISAITPLPAELSPITRRPDRQTLGADSVEAVFGLAQAFTPGDIERLRRAAGQAFGRLKAAVMRSSRLNSLLDGRPLVREAVVTALLAELDAAPLPAGCCEDDKVPGSPEVAGVPPLELAPGSALRPFQRYCFGCHRGSPLPALDFLGADSEPEVWRQLDDRRRRIADTLDWDATDLIMPPPGSRQWRLLQADREAGGEPLAELRQALRDGGPQARHQTRWPLVVLGGLLVAAALLYMLLALLGLLRRRRQERRSLDLQQQHWQQQLEAIVAQRRRIEQQRLPGQPLWDGCRRFEVTERSEESDGVVSLLLRPFDGRPLSGFIAGQYLTLELHPAGSERPVVRCYSLSDRPRGDSCRITIKRERAPADQPDAPAGLASNWIHDQLKPGMVIDVRSPAGRFVVGEDTQQALVFIVGGIGITPVMSILEALAEQGSERLIQLFYSVRDGSRLLFGERLRELEGLLPGLKLQVSYSRPRPEDQAGQDYDLAGRIDFARLQDTLPSSNFQFYLCGPAAMTESLVGALLAWGVPRQHIRYEAYHAMSVDLSSSDRRELAGLRARVRFARSGHDVDWDPQADSLLELAEANGITIDSGCRAGNCGSCRVGIQAGEVRYIGHHDLDPEPGSCLACVTVPRGDLVLDA